MNLTKVLADGTLWNMLLSGFLYTIESTVISLLIAFVLGLLACLMGLSRSKLLNLINRFYLWIIRGTPLIVQAFYIYFAMPQLIQACGKSMAESSVGIIASIGASWASFRIQAFTAGVVTLCLNAGAYLSEIFRSGISAVDKGQMEAARSLGLSKGRAMYRVILPQALKICVPSIVNQFIITLKDTSIVSVIGFAEIVYQAKIYIGRTMDSFATWTLVACFYLLAVTILTTISKQLERRMNNNEKKQKSGKKTV